jgi:hypothetical protein
MEANQCQKNKTAPAPRQKPFLKRQQLLMKRNIIYRARRSARKEMNKKMLQL